MERTMSDQHEHKWGIASRNGYEAKFRCKFWDCAETLTPEQVETMLNEHAALKRRIDLVGSEQGEEWSELWVKQFDALEKAKGTR